MEFLVEDKYAASRKYFQELMDRFNAKSDETLRRYVRFCDNRTPTMFKMILDRPIEYKIAANLLERGNRN